MSREAWRGIKRSKGFYTKFYRRLGSILGFSIILNLLLGLGIAYVYFNLPERDYYATSGITPPIMLTAMDSANTTDTPLLAEEEATDSGVRALPN